MTPVLCRYCTQPATLVPGAAIYPHREDLAAKRFWHRKARSAWVGCHPGTTKPLGILANAALRRAGLFDEDLCRRAVEICSRVGKRQPREAAA